MAPTRYRQDTGILQIGAKPGNQKGRPDAGAAL